MSQEILVLTAFDTDRAGYARSSLEDMLRGKRAFQLRATVAFANALELPLTEIPEYPLQLVRYLIDETIQGLDPALANFEDLDIRNPPELTRQQVFAIKIKHRKTDTAKSTKARTS